MKKKLNKNSLNGFINYGIILVVYLVLQFLIGGGMVSNSLQSLLVPACCYVVMAMSLNLTVGILGELSLGHAGFMSLGAFSGIVTSILLQSVLPAVPLRLAVSMAAGALAGGLGGVIVGVPVLRLRGDYLAIVTLAFGQIIKNIIMVLYVGVDGTGLHVALNSDRFILAEDGTTIIKGPMGAVGVTKLASFTAGFVLILITLLVVQNLVNSRAGRAIMALRDNRIAAESVGINVTKYKLMAFVISAALAGAAGALFGLNYSSTVASKFDFNTSILVLVFVVLGGLGSIRGSMIAAALLYVLPELLRSFDIAEYRMLIYAIILILVMLATNNPTLKNFFGSVFKKKKKPASRTSK
ncbi:MAG: branched-chain amino acid ABC transporter permease [Oscillospiraceae bacterium]|jgi:branched-chain amino acid transport system permease protein|nr:branched-chain amino acid ABC transporter permease [Oscillospiraceae bacterium]